MISVPVSITKNAGINTFAFGFDYDSTKLELVNVTINEALGGQFAYAKKAVWINGKDITYTGDILTLTFKVSENVTDCETDVAVTCNLGEISNYQEEDLVFDLISGKATIVSTMPCKHSGGNANCQDKAICELCGEAYGDINANNHKTVVADKAIAPTCSKDGITEGSHCDACNTVIITQVVDPATGAHKYNKEVITEKYLATEATCTAKAKYYKSCECGLAGTAVFEAGKALGHNMGSYIVIKQPTCTDKGTEEAKCTRCDYKITNNIPEKGHSYNKDTCTNCGKTKVENCNHMCHKTGFMGFMWKIVQFFWKLFKMNPVCECGAVHY